MNDFLMILLKVSLVIFMAGNLLDMGLRLNPQDALRGLRSVRLVAHTLLWGFAVGPALAYAITLLQPEQRIVLSTGMAPRNLGAALAPLFSIAEVDQRAIIMVVLGLPIMVIFALLSSIWFGHPASTAHPDSASSVPEKAHVN